MRIAQGKATDEPAPAEAPPGRGALALPLTKLTQAIGNRATARLARFALVATGNYTILGGGAEFEAQEVGGKKIVGGKTAAPANIRVSSDGNMAIEDTNLSVRQPKVFYATATVLADANTKLAAVDSSYELFAQATGVLQVQVPGGGGTRTLDRIVPRFRTQPGSAPETMPALAGTKMYVGNDCIDVANAVMRHGDDARQPRLSGPGATVPDRQGPEWHTVAFMIEWVKESHKRSGGVGWKNFWLAFSTATHEARSAFAKKIKVNDLAATDKLALGYAQIKQQHPALAAQIAQQLGVDTYAEPDVGEAYETRRIGVGRPASTSPGGPTGMTRHMWNQHIGAVVAVSGQDRVTLENYARSHEIGSLGDNDPHYYFQMYGPAGQTWHEAWTTGARAAGLPSVGVAGDEALTTVIRHRPAGLPAPTK